MANNGPVGSARNFVHDAPAKRALPARGAAAKRQLPWIGQSPELISGIHRRKIGPARLLLDFYTQHQTDAHGRVWYGKTISYRWIASRIVECPPKRTLERMQRQLREGGYIETRTVIHDGAAVGFAVRLRNQAKFNTRPARLAGEQLGLLNQPVRFPARAACAANGVEKPVETAPEKKISAGGVPSNLTGGTVKSVGAKEVLQNTSGGNNQNPRAETARAVQNSGWQELREFRQRQKQRRILGEIERIREVYAGASDPDALARRDYRLAGLYEQLEATAWQDERAG